MQFFKRILQPAAAEIAPEKRKGGQRFGIGSGFPLRATLEFMGRGGRPVGGRVLDCSEPGLRLLVATGAVIKTGEVCDLRLDLEGFQLVVPCHVSNQRGLVDGLQLGLRCRITDDETLGAYRQFLEVVMLGATLKPRFRATTPDAAGFLAEQYVGERRACLNVWRFGSTRVPAAADFILKDCTVRLLKDHAAAYYLGPEAGETARAAPEQSLEIHRLFHWVTANLAVDVPADVQQFLLSHAR